MGPSTVSLAKYKYCLKTLMRAIKEMQNPPLSVLLFKPQQESKDGLSSHQVETVNSMVINEPGPKLENGLLVSST